jgi:AraC-like DNA-binding protein
MRFPSSVLELPQRKVSVDSDLMRLLTQYAEDVRSSSIEQSPIGPVASTVAKQMGHELPTLASTAKLLRVTERTLQRRLAGSGVTYSQVFDDVRRSLALRFLGDPIVNIAQVGFMLHFADESAFQRAFKRWTNQTPGQYRRSRAAEEPAIRRVTDARARPQASA